MARDRCTTKEQDKKICRMYRDGKSGHSIADEFEFSSAVVYDRLEEYGVDRRGGSGTSKYVNHYKFDTIREFHRKIYWLGFFLADGSISTYPSGTYRIRMGLGIQDLGHLLKWKRFVDSEHKIQITDKASGDGHVSCHFEFSSNRIGEKFISLGIVQNKSQGYKIKKPFLLNHRCFWRGLIDGDGGVSMLRENTKKETPVIYLAGNQGMLKQFRDFLGKNGYYSDASIFFNQNKTFSLAIGGKIGVEIMNFLYSNSDTHLNRKFERYKQIVNKY